MRKVLRIAIMGGLVIMVSAACVVGLGYWQSRRYEETTDNAYLRADITSLASKVPGYVVDVQVDDNQHVNVGDVLFRIDDRDYRARLAQADANMASAKAALSNLAAERSLQRAIIAQTQAQLASAAAGQSHALLNFERYKSLVRTRTASEVRISEFADSDFSKSRTLVSLIRGQFSRSVFQACC